MLIMGSNNGSIRNPGSMYQCTASTQILPGQRRGKKGLKKDENKSKLSQRKFVNFTYISITNPGPGIKASPSKQILPGQKRVKRNVHIIFIKKPGIDVPPGTQILLGRKQRGKLKFKKR